ncbi:MAG TPA: tetratricopeptide repeat protein, partial [Gemmatimonadales bacterium]|nr:tetratricopeptide repeat protein [Gemmatimonadales bacterium]
MSPLSVPFADDPAHRLRELVRASRFQEALALHRRLADAAEAGAARRAEIELLAATAATRVGDLERGEALAGAALERFHERVDADGRMRALNLLGAIAWERGRLDAAAACWSEATALAHQLRDSLVAAHASNNLALVAHLRGQPEVALGLFRTALLSYQRLGDRRGTAQAYHNLSLSFRQLGDRREAESTAREAVRHAELVG